MMSESMSEVSVLREKPEMFEQRAEHATDPISKQHYRNGCPLSAAPGRAPRRGTRASSIDSGWAAGGSSQ
jgi:hypothetical protein